MRIGQNAATETLERESILENIERRVGSEKKYYPYLTFSREPGSGGKPVAALVAKILGYKLYDKRLIEQVAAKMGKSSKVISKVDERQRSGMMDWMQNMFNPDYVSDEAYFRNLCQVILKLSQQGGVVIVGRGANFITPKAYGLQVQVVAPYRVRVARAISHERIDFAAARDVIRKATAEREGFVRQYFGKDIHASKYYDLTINTTFLSVEESAKVVIAAYKAKFPDVKLKTAKV